MSPEQARGERLEASTDLYSFGILLQEMFSGEAPYEETDPAALFEAVKAARRRRPTAPLPPGVAGLVQELLALDPSSRPTARETQKRLLGLLEAPAARRRRRRGWLALAAAALLALASAWGAVRWARPTPLFTAGETPRLVVLPLENRTGDPSLQWVERGLAEMLAENLSDLPGLQVVPLPEVLDFLERRRPGSAPPTVAELGRALGATAVLSGRAEEGAGGGTRFIYRTERPGVAGRERRLEAKDLFAGANELAAHLSRRLVPGALAPDLRDRYSEDPFVNRLYATGLDRLRSERGGAAESFFRSVRELDSSVPETGLRLAESLAFQSRWPEAETEALAAVEAARQQASPQRTAAGFNVLAAVAYGRDDRPKAVEWSRQALAAAREAGDPRLEADAAYNLGRTLRFLDPAEARTTLERARDLYRQEGARLGEAKAVHVLGVLADEGGDAETAESFFLEALAAGEELDTPRVQAVALDSLALLATRERAFEEGLGLLLRALDLHRQSGERRAQIFTLNNLGDTYQDLGRVTEAEASFRQAEELCAATDAPNPCALIGFNFAELLLLTGRAAEARPLAERAEAFFGIEDPDLKFLRSLLLVSEGREQEARSFLELASAAVDEERAKTFHEGFDQMQAQTAGP
ncbi:MAG: tetratricopeptide repeat protein, partial [Acidobacteria bacterium]|nr:tetratricopeptide repeat protein [Acidobacteriota bacterium]